MAEGNRRQDQIHGAAEVMRRGTQEAIKGGAEVIGQAGKAVARQGDAALEATARQAGEATARGAEVVQRSGAEITRRTEAMETGGRQLAQGTVQGAIQGPAQMQAALQPAMAGMLALPQAFAGLLGDMARAQWQIGQDMLRLANPVALLEMQQRMLHGYLDLILAGQAKLDRTARTAEAAMPGRPGA